MKRKLVLLFDGTWNNRKDRTNVTLMKKCLISSGEGDAEQPCYYDTGVGTHWYDRWTGAAFGRGLSTNIRQGYQWLSQNHTSEDEIFLFGFSRGAYTARSLIGMITKCGLLNNPSRQMVHKAYKLYRNKNLEPDSSEAKAFRAQYSREVRIKFLGVWDTVGALGIPISHVPFSRDFYRWHNTGLSKIVDYAYHAMAVDEHRKDYNVSVWTKKQTENLDVEQRWFIGAHSNVGGGYHDDPPPNMPLRWIQTKAEFCGLKLSEKVKVGSEDHLAKINDSFAEFMFGTYKWFKRQYFRSFGTGANESVDESVWLRWTAEQNYRPTSLLEHPDKPIA